MENRAVKMIGKYALLLCILYGIQVVTNYSFSLIDTETLDYDMKYYLATGVNIFPFLLNIVAAIFINSDKKKERIEGKYSILLTVFYRPIGIVLFLLYVINQELKMKSTSC